MKVLSTPVGDHQSALSSPVRDVIFISKATPEDDEFVLWLAPRLEAEGYLVFADILNLDGGTRWRKEVTDILQTRSFRMLLCCQDTTLAKDGVLEEIGMALDLSKQLKDPKFIIPLRLKPYKKIFGIGEIQWVDFTRGWAGGLSTLLDTLQRQDVPCDECQVRINPNWESYRRRGAVKIKSEAERLTSNWLRIIEIPDAIHFFEPTGAIDRTNIEGAYRAVAFPVESHLQGFFSFASLSEANESLSDLGKFHVVKSMDITSFMKQGDEEIKITSQAAANLVQSMFRKAWNNYCRNAGLLEYEYSKGTSFHAGKEQARIGQKFPWGKQGENRSSMLRNISKNHVWQFGVTSSSAFWPFPHFKLKSRVLFASQNANEAGEVIKDTKRQHRLRRTVCKGWRNKQWHGRIMAFLELLSGDSSYVQLALSPTTFIRLEASPILFSSPVSTDLPNKLQDDEEEQDLSTLGRPEPEDEQL